LMKPMSRQDGTGDLLMKRIQYHHFGGPEWPMQQHW
jgi:hypothetical protein